MIDGNWGGGGDGRKEWGEKWRGGVEVGGGRGVEGGWELGARILWRNLGLT